MKSRARASFASGNYPEAEVLYSKGLEVSEGDAVLFSNRALARLNLGKAEEALTDGESAVKADPKYVKGHWRKGQALLALKSYKDALKAFEDGLELEPGNKALKKEVDKCRVKLEQESMFDDGPPPISPAKKSSKTVSKAVSKTVKAEKKASASSPPDAPTGEDEEDAVALNKSDVVRGYKLTKDGKKTSFFTHEQTAEEKALIGDITPKQISSADAAATPAAKANVKGVSSWNSAGTWEEKDVSGWAKETCKNKIEAATFTLPAGVEGAVVKVVEVKNFEGDASVATVRGKRRFIYDFNFTVKWEVELEGHTVKGQLKFPDVALDCDGEYESTYEIDRECPPAARPLLDRFVKNDRESLKEEIVKAIGSFVEEFKEKYS